MAKSGLGRGFGALIGEAAAESGSSTNFTEVKLSLIKPNPNQPRNDFNEERIEDLAKSIKKDGLLQPIIVRPKDEGYEIVAGERRHHACKKVGLDTIPVKIITLNDAETQAVALVENLQRDNLNPIEEAWGYKRLMEIGGYKQVELADIVSKNPSTISNALRLLDLPEEIQEMMFDGKISAGHARAILSIPPDKDDLRRVLANKIAAERLSVREAEQAAKLYAIQGEAGGAKREPSPKSFKMVARKLRHKLDTTVKVRTTRGKNKIEIEFIDEEDLQRIMRILEGVEEQ